MACSGCLGREGALDIFGNRTSQLRSGALNLERAGEPMEGWLKHTGGWAPAPELLIHYKSEVGPEFVALASPEVLLLLAWDHTLRAPGLDK